MLDGCVTMGLAVGLNRYISSRFRKTLKRRGSMNICILSGRYIKGTFIIKAQTDRCIYGLLANECYRLPWYDSGPLKFKIEVASRSE